jgi:hypothetical protein
MPGNYTCDRKPWHVPDHKSEQGRDCRPIVPGYAIALLGEHTITHLLVIILQFCVDPVVFIRHDVHLTGPIQFICSYFHSGLHKFLLYSIAQYKPSWLYFFILWKSDVRLNHFPFCKDNCLHPCCGGTSCCYNAHSCQQSMCLQ